MTICDEIERAVVAGACQALYRRVAMLRKHAADLTTVVEHHGRLVPVAAPEASVALHTAKLFEECALALAGAAVDQRSPEPPRQRGEKTTVPTHERRGLA